MITFRGITYAGPAQLAYDIGLYVADALEHPSDYYADHEYSDRFYIVRNEARQCLTELYGPCVSVYRIAMRYAYARTRPGIVNLDGLDDRLARSIRRLNRRARKGTL